MTESSRRPGGLAGSVNDKKIQEQPVGDLIADFDLDGYLSRWSSQVEATLDEVLPPAGARPASLHEAMRYSVFAGGKRLRPALCAAGCEAVGGDGRATLRVGAAIEMIHTYSLIHDDLPAMDDDDLRRGKPTCHKQFGEAVAILAGDALLTEAFGVMVADPAISDGLKARLVRELVAAAGAGGVVGGQVVDMEKEGAKFNGDDVDYIHLHKTAAMISYPVAAGALIGGGSEAQVEALRGYGRALGLAFQIVDDVLNVTGGQGLGKGVGTDAARGKATYPALYGVDGSRERAGQLCEQGLAALSGFGDRALPLKALARFVVERGR